MHAAGKDAARGIMTMRRLFIGAMLLTGLSLISWVRADNSPESSRRDPVIVEDAINCGGNHDEAFHRYRTNQSHHWRQIVIGTH
jgi:hypothetical protein